MPSIISVGIIVGGTLALAGITRELGPILLFLVFLGGVSLLFEGVAKFSAPARREPEPEKEYKPGTVRPVRGTRFKIVEGGKGY